MIKKKEILVGLILGLVLSLFVMGFAFKVSAPTMFFKEIVVPYDFEKTVSMIESRINKQDGWHVTTIINQQKEIIDNGG